MKLKGMEITSSQRTKELKELEEKSEYYENHLLQTEQKGQSISRRNEIYQLNSRKAKVSKAIKEFIQIKSERVLIDSKIEKMPNIRSGSV